MRIVHISDIHFSSQNADKFNQFYVKAICDDLAFFNKERKIDAICLTGDLIDKGGKSFGTTENAYNIFLNEFWKPISQKTGVSNKALFIIPGNHDLDEGKIDEYYEPGMLSKLSNLQSIEDFVSKNYTPNNIGLARQEDFKKFEHTFYQDNDSSHITNFESCHTLALPIGLVGFACINTSWRCSKSLPTHNLVIGTSQIRKSASYLKSKGCKYMIALMHHPLDFISEIERDEALTQLQGAGYNAVLFGHTHQGKTTYTVGNTGNIFVSTARTGFSNPNEETQAYTSGYTILDFNFDTLTVDCNYRKYVHKRIEFDKDVDSAKNGFQSFPIKSINSPDLCTSTDTKLNNIDSAEITEDEQNDDVLGKAVKLFIQERDKLDFNSSKTDVDFVKKLEREIMNQISFPLIDKLKNVPALQDKFIENLFNTIYESEALSTQIISDIQLVRDDKTIYSWYERKIIINSITLSILTFKKFDPKKINLLIDFLTDFEEKVWESSLAGLTIALLYQQNKWERFNDLKTRLATLQDLTRVQIGLQSIEYILRFELYKSSFFHPALFQQPFFSNPLNCFLPFYENNPILVNALNSPNQSQSLNTADFEKAMNTLPFLDSYKYTLCLAAENDELEEKELTGEKYHYFMKIMNYSSSFFPYHNIIVEYYNFLNFYPESKLTNVFSSTLSLNQNKLKNIIFDKINALVITAEAQMYAKNYSLAIQTFAKILEIDKNHYSANWKTAECFLSLSKPDAFNALKFFTRLYEINPKDSTLLIEISVCYRILKNKEKQLFFLELAQTVAPESKSVLTKLGDFYIMGDNYNKALTFYKKAVKLYPTYDDVLLRIAKTYSNLDNNSLALKYAKRTEQYVSSMNKEDLYSLLTTLYSGDRQYAKSVEYGQMLHDLGAKGSEHLMTIGRAYLFGPKADLRKARTYLEKALKEGENYLEYGNIGHLELIAGNELAAIYNYKKSVSLFKSLEKFNKSMDFDEPLMLDTGVSIDTYNAIRKTVTQDIE
jgi:tetratricopeptide (TPR) repeat protein/predicted MPP superfamily phosphohydrolase